ncbi:MAG TPA: hypothetical protein VJ739_03830 [Gemmataceae bacterium]|nr:hypothetical protein [Gemmataceae bacterium]
MTRSRLTVLVALGAFLVGAVAFAGGQPAKEQPPAQQEQLRELLKRVERLEARVAELERREPRVVVPAQGGPQLRVLPEGALDAQRVPKGWVPREFNGQRYYDIPLAKTPAGR